MRHINDFNAGDSRGAPCRPHAEIVLRIRPQRRPAHRDALALLVNHNIIHLHLNIGKSRLQIDNALSKSSFMRLPTGGRIVDKVICMQSVKQRPIGGAIPQSNPLFCDLGQLTSR